MKLSNEQIMNLLIDVFNEPTPESGIRAIEVGTHPGDKSAEKFFNEHKFLAPFIKKISNDGGKWRVKTRKKNGPMTNAHIISCILEFDPTALEIWDERRDKDALPYMKKAKGLVEKIQ